LCGFSLTLFLPEGALLTGWREFFMIYAINENLDKIEATPGLRAFCPSCKNEVISKCGDIKIWHWAHLSVDSFCDHTGETEWHIKWKSYFDKSYIEVPVIKNGLTKIADIKEKSGLVIEFQNSPITTHEIRLRETHYENMIWVFNCTEQYDKDMIRLDFKNRTFFWYRPKESIFYCAAPIFLHLQNDLLIKIIWFNLGNGHCRGDFIEYDVENFLWEYSSLIYSKIISTT